jgi:hypothetical protein
MSSPISPALQAASAPAASARGLGAGRAGASRLAMRVSDAERAEVADELSRHYSEGRLDEGEFSQRLDHVMAATTYRDLTGVLQDLPPLWPVPRSDRRPRPASGSDRVRRPSRVPGAGLKLALLAFLLILVVSVSHIAYWALAPFVWICLIVALVVTVRRRR